MSDQLIVEREGLEKKDKGELQAIVSALGGSSSARMRKAELIDQILELSGATTRAAEADPTGDDNASDIDSADAEITSGDQTDAGPVDAGSSPAGSPDAVSADEAPDKPDVTSAESDGSSGRRSKRSSAKHPSGPDGEPLADWEVKVLEEGGRPSDSRSRGGNPSGRPGGDGGGRGTNANGSKKGNGSQSSTKPPKGDKPNSGDKSGSSGDRQRDREESDEDVDPNNRRSRRRGRNRGRDRDDVGNPAITSEPIEVTGYLDLRDEGYAFLRVNGALPSRDDAYVSVKQVRQYGLRKGDRITGFSRPANRNEKNPALHSLNSLNGKPAEESRGRPRFDKLTPLFPDERLVLETKNEPLNMTNRIIDLVSPIGKGQRGLIVSPPKAGKTSIMKNIARAIEINNPEVSLIVLLVDERPEEVTDMRRHLKNAEVIASTFDRPPEEHTAVAELTIERAKRLVEQGDDVCLIVDGITRLARAHNMSANGSGRLLSGGVDAAALYPPKRFFGSARNIEEGGSLTILATALVETGSKMDEVIFEEFKGTGNMELRLDRRLAERRIFPAIDIAGSSTRNEELLRERKEVEASWKLRKVIAGMNDEGGSPASGVEMLVERLATFKTNAEFLSEIGRAR